MSFALIKTTGVFDQFFFLAGFTSGVLKGTLRALRTLEITRKKKLWAESGGKTNELVMGSIFF